MKKIINFMLLNLGLIFPLKAGDILHLRKEKLKELNKDFRESMNFLRSKNQQMLEERTNKIIQYQKKIEDMEKLSEISQKDKEEIAKIEANLESFILNQNEELQKAFMIFENKIDSDIKEVIKKININVPIIEGEIVIYGGRDVTKELNDALNEKDVKILNPKFDSKIYSFDNEEFNNKSKGAKDIQKYIEQKIEEIKRRQKEFISQSKEKDFNREEAEKILRNMQNELQSTQQLMVEKLINDIEKALIRIASKKKIDLVLASKLLYSDAPSIVKEVMQELENNEEFNYSNVKSSNSSLVGFVNYENILNKYKKYEEKRKELEKKSKEFEKILEDKINQIQKLKDNDKNNSKKSEIEKLENEYDQIRNLKSQQFQQLVKETEEEILNDVKTAAKVFGIKNKLELILVKPKNAVGIFYAGRDLTQDILNIISNK